MSQNVCVFVDGENLRHTIIELFPEFNKNDYLPNGKWEELFDWIVENATNGKGERLRTYWYVIGAVDFYPYRIPRLDYDPEGLRRVLSQHPLYREELEKLVGQELKVRMEFISSALREEKRHFNNRFQGWQSIQNGISLNHTAVEFRRSGIIAYNLFDHTLGPEKAVDVKLATDMIKLRDIYNTAVIVSGDQDYVPAVETVKDFGKRVVNVSFQARGGALFPGGAWRLNQAADLNLKVAHAQFKEFLNLPD